MHYNNVVVTTDFSQFSTAAFPLAAQEVKDKDGKLTLLTVVSDWVVPPSMYEEIPLPERIDEYRNEVLKTATARIEKLGQEHFSGQKITTKVILSVRSVGQEIGEFARSEGCDLIVMASHGRGAVASAILGSVAQKVLGVAHCPVLIVPSHAASAVV